MPNARLQAPHVRLGHERRFRDLRGTSAYPPKLAVKADIPDRQVRANSGREKIDHVENS